MSINVTLLDLVLANDMRQPTEGELRRAIAIFKQRGWTEGAIVLEQTLTRLMDLPSATIDSQSKEE